MTSLLHRCIILATESHAGQVDKAGEPYILHPLRVMCDPSLTTEVERCVAVLHDVIEDCGPKAQSRLELYPSTIESRVHILTRKAGEDYRQYIQQICDTKDPIVIRVKLADIRDNTDPVRLRSITDSELLDRLSSLRQRYMRAAQMLRDALRED